MIVLRSILWHGTLISQNQRIKGKIMKVNSWNVNGMRNGRVLTGSEPLELQKGDHFIFGEATYYIRDWGIEFVS